MKKNEYVVYTDGSFRLPNFGSYSVLILHNNVEETCLSGPIFDTTINRMELFAIYTALAYFKHPATVTMYSDSQYAVNCVTRWAAHWRKNQWKTMTGDPVKNQDLIEKIYDLTKIHYVRLHWVRGHSGNTHNERCDKIARDITKNMVLRVILPPST